VFLTTTAAGAATFAFPAVLRAQSKDPIRIGFPAPLTGPFSAIAADMKQGAELAVDELNAKGGILGRKVEVLIRDDQLKPQVGAQRTQELIEKEGCQFIVASRRARADGDQRADEEAKVLFISTSQSTRSAPSRTRAHHLPRGAQSHDHLPRGRQVGDGEPRQEVVDRLRRLRLGQAEQHGAERDEQEARRHRARQPPYPLGSAEFSAHLPKIQAAKPECSWSCTPGADNIAFLKQVKSFGMHQQMKIAQPLHWISVAKQGGPSSTRISTAA